MEIKETKEGEITVVTIAGRLDSTNYIGFEKSLQVLIDKDERKLLLDCTDLAFLSSAGLRALLGILKKMNAAGGQFALCSLNEAVRKIFDISGFLKIFTIYDTRAEALKNLA